MEIYFHLSSATHHQELTDPLHWVDWSTLAINFLVPPYLPTLELIQMSQDPLPYPPQIWNGGSPPAHLSLSLDSHAVVEQAVATTAAAMKTAIDLAMEKMWAAMLAESTAADEADKQHCHETATHEKALANNAKMQCRQESAKCAAVLAELVLAAEQNHRESVD